MKTPKLVTAVLLLFAAVFVAIGATLFHVYDTQKSLPTFEEVYEIAYEVANTDSCEIFDSAEAAIEAKSVLSNRLNLEKDFAELPDLIVHQICSVLEKQSIPLKPTTIVHEYKVHRTVYDGLNSSQIVQELSGPPYTDSEESSDTINRDSLTSKTNTNGRK